METCDSAVREPLIHTYSIVARDPETGELGVAVQSHYFSVGSVVTWAEAGVGAVATQSIADPAYGKLGLDLMRAGRSAPDALAGLVASDPMSAARQVGMVDAYGRAAAHTGKLAIAEAGHITGDGFCVQANMMLRPSVWPAMAEAYKSANGEFVDRLLSALDAAETKGGDIRGLQSAAILIVASKNTGRSWVDKLYDVRVDDAPDPLKELRRLVSVARAYIHQRRAQSALEQADRATMEREFETACQLIGDNPELRFWHAIGLLSVGEIDAGIALLREIAHRDRNWITLALRLPAPLLKTNPEVLEKIRQLA
ncbi:MAG TPA: DUF1028 domain-containing protein [Candidatus Binataceae bacterium]|nr:DUF1028 domain-containing protein [Candidatus Binataceae bacterium]